MKTLNIFKNLIVAVSLLAASTGSAAELCSAVLLGTQNPAQQTAPVLDYKLRTQIVGSLIQGKNPPWVQLFEQDAQVIYKGQHKYVPGTEFLASNEHDWARTPYSKKKADVLVAFATNTAWEIMIAQSPKHVVIADWSPNPLMGHAYVVAPLMKISKTPQEFLTYLSGKLPDARTNSKSVDEVLNDARQYMSLSPQVRFPYTQKLVDAFIGRSEVSDKELGFLSSYFLAQAGMRQPRGTFGPFQGLRDASFADFIDSYDGRYNTEATTYFNGKGAVKVLNEMGALTNAANFAKLRSYFVEGRISYAITSVMDVGFYQHVIKAYQSQGLNNMILSLTNIFDCGSYNQLTFQHYQALLKSVATELGVSPGGKELTVYRTTNWQFPHGFYRYEIDSVSKVPMKDEKDSQADHGREVNLDGMQSAS
jgi:hypothetical protein